MTLTASPNAFSAPMIRWKSLTRQAVVGFLFGYVVLHPVSIVIFQWLDPRLSAAHPERFVRQPPRSMALPEEVWINPPADRPQPRALQLPRDTNFEKQVSQTG